MDISIHSLSNHNPLLSDVIWASLIEHFGPNSDLLVLRNADNANEMVLIDKKHAFIYASFVPSQAQISLMTFKRLPQKLIRNFFQEHPNCLRLDLLCLDSDHLLAEDIEWDYKSVSNHTHTMSIQLEGSFEEYWSQRPRNLKKNIKRYFSRLQSENMDLELRILSQPEDLKPALDRYGILESSGWKGKMGTAIHPDNQQGAFYWDFLKRYAEQFEVNFFELYLNGELAASRICVLNAEMMVILKTTYDESKKNFAVGRLLLHELIKHEFSQKRVAKIEFYTNASKEQLDWSTDSRYIYHCTLYRNKTLEKVIENLSSIKNIKSRYLSDKNRRGATAMPKTNTEEWELREFHSYREFSDDTKQLLNQGCENYLFSNYEYLSIYEDTVLKQEHATPKYLAVYHKGTCSAILPIIEKKGIITLFSESLTNYYFFRYDLYIHPEVYADRNKRANAYNVLHQALRHYDRVRFSPAHKNDSKIRDFVYWLEEQGWKIEQYPYSINWTTYIESIEAYKNNLPSKLKNTIRRAENRLSRHQHSINVFQQQADIDSAIQDYWSVYEKSWKRMEPYPEFINQVIKHYAKLGQCILGVIYIEQKPVAVQIWFHQGNTAYIYKLAYATDYQKWSVGNVLTLKLIEFCVNNLHINKIDFLNGNDAFKSNWMDQSHPICGYNCINMNSMVGKVEHQVNNMKDLLKSFRAVKT